MSPAEILPAELWLIIFRLVVGTTIGPEEICDYSTYSTVALHLRLPWKQAPLNNLWPKRIRLVCRRFNELFGSSPYLFMKGEGVIIPDTTRAVYLSEWPSTELLLAQLLSEPQMAQKITTLDIPGPNTRYSGLNLYFDLLCDNAASLPGVRTLGISLRHYDIWRLNRPPITEQFWSRLYDAFPLLVCLTLRGCLQTTHDDRTVSFDKMQILDMDQIRPESTVHFPVLRHAAFASVSNSTFTQFTDWHNLESLLIRGIERSTRFTWEMVPQLRLLGLPGRRVFTFPPLPPNNPLQQLHIFVGTLPRDDHNQIAIANNYARQMAWLTKTIKRLPTISRMSLEFYTEGNTEVDWIGGHFDEDDLGPLGLEVNEKAGHGYYRNYKIPYHVILDRVPVRPATVEEVAPAQQPPPKEKGLRAEWRRFRQYTSSRLHL